ncbi:MAG: mannose-1-phosphate guanylyltransferase/mannose-6-phosphate isomerase [Candidatus Omnitrophota bacterium]
MRLKDKESYYAVILAGGQGSRFWPQSRTLEPKQFLSFYRDKSLFEQTLERIKPLIPAENTIIVTSDLYRHQIHEFIKPFNIPDDNLIFEPEGKNTAPSIAVAAQMIFSRDPDSRVCVMPCDHLIKHSRQFIKIISRALALCKDRMVIFGIPPHRPATGYGYIKAGKKTGAFLKVDRFCEKPDIATARRFVKSGAYFWNSGIFAASSRTFLEEFKTYLPDLYRQTLKINSASDLKIVWKKIKPESFDYGILEKSRRLLMIPAEGLGWSDLGSWQAWDEVLEKDKDTNILNADVVSLHSKNITVVGNNRLIATIGLDDLIIVDTADALLVARKNKTEHVKSVVDILKQKGRLEHYAHRTVKRPWGSYTVLESGSGYKVKLVEVKPKHSLSLQYHNKRSEHWVVVEGRARLVKGKRTCVLETNQSIYVPVGCVHRITNPGDGILKIIEVQAGAYLGEDDIVRLKDDFGRLSR